MSAISQHAREAAEWFLNDSRQPFLASRMSPIITACVEACQRAIDASQAEDRATISELREQLANASKQDALLRHLNNETLEERDSLREQLAAATVAKEEISASVIGGLERLRVLRSEHDTLKAQLAAVTKERDAIVEIIHGSGLTEDQVLVGMVQSIVDLCAQRIQDANRAQCKRDELNRELGQLKAVMEAVKADTIDNRKERDQLADRVAELENIIEIDIANPNLSDLHKFVDQINAICSNHGGVQEWPPAWLENALSERDSLAAKLAKYGDLESQLESYKSQWRSHYEKQVSDFEFVKQAWFTQHLNQESDDLRARLAETQAQLDAYSKEWALATLTAKMESLQQRAGKLVEALQTARVPISQIASLGNVNHETRKMLIVLHDSLNVALDNWNAK